MTSNSEYDAFKARIEQACIDIGLKCTAEQTKKLQDYVAAMHKWNKTYNLTAVRQPSQMLVQHVFDSMTPVPFLFDVVGSAQQPRLVCDVGSGGGLPGVVIAALAPAWAVQCIDAVEKKTAFVRQMIGTLELPNLKATHARVEQLAEQNADIVISRAFASLLDFATWSGKHVKEGGHLVAMKGKIPDDEIEALQARTPWRVEHVQPLAVPELNAQRCLVWMRRNEGNS